MARARGTRLSSRPRVRNQHHISLGEGSNAKATHARVRTCRDARHFGGTGKRRHGQLRAGLRAPVRRTGRVLRRGGELPVSMLGLSLDTDSPAHRGALHRPGCRGVAGLRACVLPAGRRSELRPDDSGRPRNWTPKQTDALQLVHLYAERGSPKYERAALRWLHTISVRAESSGRSCATSSVVRASGARERFGASSTAASSCDASVSSADSVSSSVQLSSPTRSRGGSTPYLTYLKKRAPTWRRASPKSSGEETFSGAEPWVFGICPTFAQGRRRISVVVSSKASSHISKRAFPYRSLCVVPDADFAIRIAQKYMTGPSAHNRS